MDIDLLEMQQQEPEEEPLPVTVVQPTTQMVDAKKEFSEAAEKERRIRQLELAKWAEERRIISDAPPTPKQLQKVKNRLKKGNTLIKAIRNICSYSTWQKWREEYPEVLALEEQAREERIDMLMDKKLALADQPNRVKMGEIARDKVHMDELQNQIDRMDRLTELRNKKKTGAFGTGVAVPIQINVGYGKKTS